MKKIFIILFSLISFTAFADDDNYYVDNTGTGDTLATITEVMALSLNPDDSVFFKKGCIWRLVDDPGGSFDITAIGTSGHNVVYASYGTGDKPRILGSDTITTWTQVGATNVWWGYKASLNAFGTTGRIWFEELAGTVAWGILETAKANINAAYEFYYSNDTVYVYSTSDPSTAFVSVEIPQVSNLIELQCNTEASEYITIDGWEVAYGMDCLIRSDYPGGVNGSTRQLRGVEIRNCHIHHTGIKNGSAYGTYLHFSDVIIEDNEINDAGRRNISIQPDNSFHADTISNYIIRHNNIHTGWHTTGLDIIVTKSGGLIEDVTYENNLVEDGQNTPIDANNPLSIQIYIDVQGDETGIIKNLFIQNNIFKYAKNNGIQIDIADSIYIYHNTFYGVNVNTTSYKAFISFADAHNASNYGMIKNNIFYTTKSYHKTVDFVTNNSSWDVNYNLYFTDYPLVSILRENNVQYTVAQWATWKSATGYDANSPTPADPLFINVTTPMETDSLMIDALSPAKDAGIGVGINLDYRDSIRDATPDIGAYEYGAIAYVPPDPPTVTTSTPSIIYTRLARGGGTVTDDGGGTVSDRGICWSTSANPSVSDSKTSNGTGTGAFTDYIPNLTAGTVYHIRGYAINETGTSYGSDLTVTTPIHSVTKTGGKILKTGGKTVVLH